MYKDAILFPKLHAAQKAISSIIKTTKLVVLRCGRRFGKTTLLEVIAAFWAVGGLKVGWFSPNYKLLLPSYKRILRLVRPMVINASKIDGIIELEGGGLIEFWTLNDEDAGRSRAYHKVIIDEASLVKKKLREIWEQSIAPTLLDYGGMAVMAGTPKGIDDENFFYVACTNKELGWVEHHLPTAANPMLNPEAVANLVNEVPPLVYQQEYLAEFVDWSGAAFFSLQNLLENGIAPEPTMYPDTIFAVIDTAVKGGKEHDGTAVTYYAVSKFRGIPLAILDYEMVQIEGSLLENWLPSVYRRLEELVQQLKPRFGSVGVFIEDKAAGTILIKQAERKGFAVYPIDSKLTSVGKDERAISVSGYVYQGKVKITRYAYDKVITFKGVTRNHFVYQVCGYRIGVKDQEDDLFDTFCYGISIGIADSKGY